jgi:septum formation protein
MKSKKDLILASKSPRRKQLMEQIGLKFKIHPSSFEEKEIHLTPEKLALHNAIGKAKEVAGQYKKGIVIGVDTVVSFKEEQINKPKNKKDAKRILRLLSGKKHKVCSGICLIDVENGKKRTGIEVTFVTMAKISEEEMDQYINSEEGFDKAGGYAIQGKGALFIKKIEGDYNNVVGLPLFLLGQLLKSNSL